MKLFLKNTKYKLHLNTMQQIQFNFIFLMIQRIYSCIYYLHATDNLIDCFLARML